MLRRAAIARRGRTAARLVGIPTWNELERRRRNCQQTAQTSRFAGVAQWQSRSFPIWAHPDFSSTYQALNFKHQVSFRAVLERPRLGAATAHAPRRRFKGRQKPAGDFGYPDTSKDRNRAVSAPSAAQAHNRNGEKP